MGTDVRFLFEAKWTFCLRVLALKGNHNLVTRVERTSAKELVCPKTCFVVSPQYFGFGPWRKAGLNPSNPESHASLGQGST